MEVWNNEDAFKGLCQLEDVGEERPVERVPEPEQASEPIEPEQVVPDILPDDMFEHEFEAYRRDPTGYKSRNPPALVVKLLATCEERRLRASVKPVYAVDTLTPKALASLSTDDLKRFVLYRSLQGMSEAQQGEAVDKLEARAK